MEAASTTWITMLMIASRAVTGSAREMIGNVLTGECLTEVSGEQVLQIHQVLDHQRLSRPYFCVIAATYWSEHCHLTASTTEGIAGKCPHERPADRGGTDQNRNELQQAMPDELQHCGPSPRTGGSIHTPVGTDSRSAGAHRGGRDHELL